MASRRQHPPVSILLAGLCGLLLAASPSATGALDLERFEFTQVQMGVPFTVSLYAGDEVTANRAVAAAFARIKELNDLLSDYDSESELLRFCRDSEPNVMRTVSPELWAMLLASQRLAVQSDGAFDVTIAPYVRLWRRARRTGELPSPERLAEAKHLVGHEKLVVDPDLPRAALSQKGMRLDLGGIAKGYAADEAIKTLATHGVTRALVAASGDIVAADAPPDTEGWRIGIAPLDAEKGEPSRYLMLRRAAVSTSGDAFQFVEIDGRRYSHIVDPRTGVGLTERMSVTVIAPNGVASDSLATTVCVLGTQRGLELIESLAGVEAFVVRIVDGNVQTKATPGFARFEDNSDP